MMQLELKAAVLIINTKITNITLDQDERLIAESHKTSQNE